MLKLVNLVFFLGAALVVGRYYGWGSSLELLGAIAVALFMMRILSGRRLN